MVTFAALRFAEDANICDRMYWYESGFPLRAGERVLAPVGVHDRLQRAVVERVFEAEAKDAPYDLRFLKRIAAKDGARLLRTGGEAFLELGGVRYDEKHYTRFGRVLIGKTASAQARGALAGYGVSAYYTAEEDGLAEILRALASERGCALIYGADADMAGAFLLRNAGVAEVRFPAGMAGGAAPDRGHGALVFPPAELTEGELARLREKLR